MKTVNQNSDLSERIWQLDSSAASFKAERARLLKEIELLPEEKKAQKLMLLGMLKAMEGEIPGMRENFEQALALEPCNKAINYNYALALYKNALFSQAILHLQKLPELNKACSATMGKCCLALGLDAKARQFLGNEQNDSPENPDAPACSLSGRRAMESVFRSFDEDSHIWQSLSTR